MEGGGSETERKGTPFRCSAKAHACVHGEWFTPYSTARIDCCDRTFVGRMTGEELEPSVTLEALAFGETLRR